MASRHLARSIVLQSLFEWDFYRQLNDVYATKKKKDDSKDVPKERDLDEVIQRNLDHFGGEFDEKDFAKNLIHGIVKHISQVDEIIINSAPERPLGQLSIVDRNVLRIGLYELLHQIKPRCHPRLPLTRQLNLAKISAGQAPASL